MEKKKKPSVLVSILKLTPIVVLAYLMMPEDMIGLGYDVLVAAPIAAAYAAIIAYFTVGLKPKDAIDIGIDNVKHILIALFILMMANAMALSFMQSGVGSSIVVLALRLGLSARTVAPVAIVVTSLLSIATGTSWGTFAATAPIFLWMSHLVGGDPIITIGAIAGGACFGDNIGLISDTTVVSSGIQGVEVIDRIRHQGVWSVSCLILGVIAFVIASAGLPTETVSGAEAIANIPAETFDVLAAERPEALALLNQVGDGTIPMYMIIPLILVIGTAIAGVPTLFCLLIGLIASLILGLTAGTIESVDFFLTNMIETGFSEAGGWVIVMMMWISFFGGIMNEMEAFEPLSRGVLKLSKSVRGLMTWNGVLSLLGNALLADEMAQIVTVGPIISDLVDENIEGSEEDMYTLHLRNATFSDALGVFGSQLIPWHVYIAYYISIATAVYPVHKFVPTDIISRNYLAMIVVASILILTATGLDRFVPLFHLPHEPEVKLIKKEN